MKELDIIRHYIANLFDAGDSDGLDRVYEILNKTVAELAVMRALLNPPANDPEQEPMDLDIELEMEPSEPAEPKMDITEGGLD